MVISNSPSPLDQSSDSRFKAYYEDKSASVAAISHFDCICDKVLAVRRSLAPAGPPSGPALKVLDIGCNAGLQAMVCAARGHDVKGLDINEPCCKLREAGQRPRARTFASISARPPRCRMRAARWSVAVRFD